MLGYSNVVNTKVAEFVKYQLHGGRNHLFYAKKEKTHGKNVISHIKLF